MNLAKAIDRLIELDEQETLKQIERATFLSLAEAAIEALPDALVVIDATGKIALFNEKAEFMFGYHRSDMLGQPVEKLMPERARPRHLHDRETYNRFDISQRARTMGIGGNLIGLRNDGFEFPVDITLARMVVPKGIYNLACIRFSRKIIEFEEAARGIPQSSPITQQNPADADAGR
jgi:protein-histidine pros-kinase